MALKVDVVLHETPSGRWDARFPGLNGAVIEGALTLAETREKILEVLMKNTGVTDPKQFQINETVLH